MDHQKPMRKQQSRTPNRSTVRVLHFPAATTPAAPTSAPLASVPAPSKATNNEDALADAIRKAWMQDRITTLQPPPLEHRDDRLTGTKG